MFDMQKGKISVRREHCRWGGVRKKPLVEMICCKKIVADEEDEFQCVGHTRCEL